MLRANEAVEEFLNLPKFLGFDLGVHGRANLIHGSMVQDDVGDPVHASVFAVCQAGRLIRSIMRHGLMKTLLMDQIAADVLGQVVIPDKSKCSLGDRGIGSDVGSGRGIEKREKVLWTCGLLHKR